MAYQTGRENLANFDLRLTPAIKTDLNIVNPVLCIAPHLFVREGLKPATGICFVDEVSCEQQYRSVCGNVQCRFYSGQTVRL